MARHAVNFLGRVIFGRFWTTLATIAAVGEWTLWCWWRDAVPAWPVHVAALAALYALNRAACEAFEVEAHAARGRHVVGRTLLAAGFTAGIGAATLAATAIAWVVVDALIAFPAQADAIDGMAAGRFGAGFDLVAGIAVTGAMSVALHGYLHGHRRLVVTNIDVPMPGLAPGLDGFRIVHLSDLHLGPLAHAEALREAIETAIALDPDVVCVTGDLVDSRFADLEWWMPQLGRLTAPHGVFAVLGNHDRHAGIARVAAALARHTCWRLLRDDVVALELPEGRLQIAGQDERRTPAARAALPALLQRLVPGTPAVLLIHHPAVFEEAAGEVPLVLAGHTHGGQIAMPGLPRLNPARLVMTRFDAGTFVRDGSMLHVSRGLGVSGQRLRIGVPREITVLTLRATDAAVAA